MARQALLVSAFVLLVLKSVVAPPPLVNNPNGNGNPTAAQAPAVNINNPPVNNNPPAAHNNQNQNAPAAGNQPHRVDPTKKPDPDANTMLSQDPACKADVERICPNYRSEDDAEDNTKRDEKKILHNFEVLDCFMSYEGDEKPPSDSCQTVRLSQSDN